MTTLKLLFCSSFLFSNHVGWECGSASMYISRIGKEIVNTGNWNYEKKKKKKLILEKTLLGTNKFVMWYANLFFIPYDFTLMFMQRVYYDHLR